MLIDMPVNLLLERVNAGAAKPVSAAELPDLFTRLGCEVEEVTATQQFHCNVCGKICDRTAAQGPPLHCTACGVDFRATPAALADLGPAQVVRLDMLAVRPDIFDPGGMARLIRGHLGIQTGLCSYEVRPPTLRVRVDPKLSHETSRRPFIACAVLRNVELTHDTIKLLMNLQEDLHWALGRNRKLASIGVYDLDKLVGPEFSYEAVAPDGVRFIPLGLPPDDPAGNLTPALILERHKTGQAYAHLLAGMSAYPLLRDARGTVLSMPPIINSEATRVTLHSRQLFCDVTGLSQRSVDRALNILVTNFKECQPTVEIEQVTIEAPDGRRTTPDLTPLSLTLDVQEAADTIGMAIDADAMTELLERMGHAVAAAASGRPVAAAAPGRPVAAAAPGRLHVRVPAWRNDVMHARDLVEDAAVAYGYDRLVPALVPTFTVGAPRPIEEHAALVRQVFVGLGFHQVMTLVLTSEPAAFDKWRLPPDERRVVIANPISVEQTMCRVSLLPGLLETFAINKQHDLPQQLFEVGDVCLRDTQAETGAGERRFAAAGLIGPHVGFADIRAVADALLRELSLKAKVQPTSHPSFIPGRAAALVTEPSQAGGAGQTAGFLGELHPEVLESYGLRHAVAVLEVDLVALMTPVASGLRA
jgi:phenylalanyl-tRNA synthetase beta chain